MGPEGREGGRGGGGSRTRTEETSPPWAALNEKKKPSSSRTARMWSCQPVPLPTLSAGEGCGGGVLKVFSHSTRSKVQPSLEIQRECLPGAYPARPASKSLFRPSIPMLYPQHTGLGVPYSQKHKSFMHDWKKWWRGSAMTTMTSVAMFACSLKISKNKCPNPIVQGRVRKSHADTCPQMVGGGAATIETCPARLAH